MRRDVQGESASYHVYSQKFALPSEAKAKQGISLAFLGIHTMETTSVWAILGTMDIQQNQ